MSNQQQVRTGGPDVQLHVLNNQVNIFLFDLKNEAIEHGFKTDESWTLQLVTEDEIAGLKKQHYPVVSLRLQPDALLKAFQQIKSKLQQPLSKNDMELTENELARDEKRHLAAYPARIIR